MAIVRKIRSNDYYIWNRVPTVILLIKLQKLKGPSFCTVNCTSATLYNCDATVTFYLIAQQWTTSNATTINISFSAINCTQSLVQLAYLESECSMV